MRRVLVGSSALHAHIMRFEPQVTLPLRTKRPPFGPWTACLKPHNKTSRDLECSETRVYLKSAFSTMPETGFDIYSFRSLLTDTFLTPECELCL